MSNSAINYKMYKQYLKKIRLLKEEVPQLIVDYFISYIYIHNDDPKERLLAGCQEIINYSFSQFLRKNFSKSGAFFAEILCLYETLICFITNT